MSGLGRVVGQVQWRTGCMRDMRHLGGTEILARAAQMIGIFALAG